MSADVRVAFPRSLSRRAAWGLPVVALLAFCAGLFIAWHHPLWPLTVTAAFLLWTVVAARYPGLWLFALPAALPLLNFSPWTGWLLFEEFDLLILGTLAGGLARLAWRPADRFSDSANLRRPAIASKLVAILGVATSNNSVNGVPAMGVRCSR